MKHLIYLIFAVVFMTNVSCKSNAADSIEEKKQTKDVEKKEKRIIRWTTDIRSNDGHIGQINISVFDPDGKNPALIEFVYQTESRKMDFLEVESFDFKLVSEQNDLTKSEKKVPFFKLGLNAGVESTYWSIFRYLPTEITFGLHRNEPFLFLTEKSKEPIPLSVRKTELTNLNFAPVAKPRTENVRLAKAKKHLSFEDYFIPKKIEFPFVFGDKKDEAIATAQQPNPAKARITRWTAELPHPTNGKKTQVTAAVFDAEINPVLIELSYVFDDKRIDFYEIEKFEVSADQNNFQVHFKDRIYSGLSSNLTPFYWAFPYFPKSLKFSLNDKEASFTLEPLKKKTEAIVFKAKREAISINDYKHVFLPVSHKVFEPSTINSISYEQYFSAKGIHFPLIKEFSATTTGSSSAPSSRSSSLEISSQEVRSRKDLNLGPLLKDKKEAIWKLLQSQHKPTLTEFLNAIGVKPSKGDKNPFKDYGYNSDTLRSDLENRLPKVIAQFEKAFPNAIWYGLGRDIYLFSDAMDAYYLYQGKQDRVRRLHASQPSFDENNPQEVVDFLKSNGFDFENINKDSTPHIIFDITSYSKGVRFSQSSQLMRAAYMEWERLKRDPHELLRKLNFVSVSKGSDNVMITPNLDINEFFEKMSFDPPAPKKILQVDGPMSLQYPAVWHRIYEPFKRNGNKVESAPGGPSYNSEKLAMLSELWDIAAVVMNGDFAAAVEKSIKEINDPKASTEIPSSNKIAPSRGGFFGNLFTHPADSSEGKKCDELLEKPIGSD